MKVYSVAVLDPEELMAPKAEPFKVFPIQFPQAELQELSDYFRGQGINRSEWARRVLIASFVQMRDGKQAG